MPDLKERPTQTTNTTDLPPLAGLDEGEFAEPALEPDGEIKWNGQLTHLPSRHFLMCRDIGLVDHERHALVASVRLGNKDAIEKVRVAQNVLLECMRRTRVKRQKINGKRQLLYKDRFGKETTEQYAPEKDARGAGIPHEIQSEMRSEFGVRPGAECFAGEGVDMPTPGQYKLQVEEHFLDLLPRLYFKQEQPDLYSNFPAETNSPELAKRMHAEKVMNNQSPERASLLRWLTPFLAHGAKCEWNGLD
jgi:hypothetical protein